MIVYPALDELVDPQSVTAVCLGHFTPAIMTSAVLFKSDLVELYDCGDSGMRLRHRARLTAPVSEASVIRSLDDKCDRVLMVLEGCRYGSMRWDENTQSWEMASLHQFSDERWRAEGLAPEAELKIRRQTAVEPRGRCAALRVYRSFMAVVPFELINGMDDADALDEGDRLPSWVCKLGELADGKLQSVIDWCFLEGYTEPTLALLVEAHGQPAWSGRAVSNKRDAKAFAIVTIDIRQQSLSLIHYQAGLPNDLHSLEAGKKPIGGCFAFGVSCLLHLEQGSATGCGVALNSFASKLSDYRFLPILSPLEVCASAGAKIVQISGDGFWLCLDDGRRLVGRVSKGSRFVSNITLCVSEQASGHLFPVSSFAAHDSMLMMASDCADTLLYQLTAAGGSPTQVSAQANDNDQYFDDDVYLREMEAEERQRLPEAGLHQIVGRIRSPGAMSSVCAALLSGSYQDSTVRMKSPRVWVGVAGRGPFAPAVAVLSPHLPLIEAARFPVPGAIAAHAASSPGSTACSFLFVSTITSTLVLKMQGDRLEEVEEGDFFLEGTTLAAGTIGSLIVQVHPYGMRLLNSGRLVGEESFAVRCVRAAIYGSRIVCLDANAGDAVYEVADEKISVVHSATECLASGLFASGGSSAVYYRVTAGGALEMFDVLTRECIFTNSIIGSLPYILEHNGGSAPGQSSPAPDHLSICADFNGNVHMVIAVDGLLACYGLCAHDRMIFVKNEARVMRVDSIHQVALDSRTVAFAVQTPSRMYLVHMGAFSYPRIHHVFGNLIHMSTLPMGSGEVQLLCVDKSGRVRISSVDRQFDIDRSDCCLLLKYLNSGDRIVEPRRIAYLPSTNAFVVISRTARDFRLPSDEYSEYIDHPEFEYAQGAPCPQQHSYSLHILSPITWTLTDQVVLNDQLGCTKYDVVVDMRICSLTTKSQQSGRKPFVVVGTAAIKGEDRPVRGRALVFDVAEVVPEPGRPETNRKLRLMCSGDMKTTVCALCELKGAVLVSQGARVIVHAFENDDTLQGCAFVDSAIFSSTAASISGLFVLGDVQRGISLYAYQEEPPRISQIARSLDTPLSRQSITCVEFLPIPPDDVYIVSADQNRNLFLHTYSPKHPRSLSGTKLIVRSSTRLPSPVRAMERLADRLFLYLLDGSVLVMTLISAAHYKRLNALLNKTYSVLPHLGGLHPRAARSPSMPLYPEGLTSFPRNILEKHQIETKLLRALAIPQLKLLAAGLMVDWGHCKADMERNELHY